MHLIVASYLFYHIDGREPGGIDHEEGRRVDATVG